MAVETEKNNLLYATMNRNIFYPFFSHLIINKFMFKILSINPVIEYFIRSIPNLKKIIFNYKYYRKFNQL